MGTRITGTRHATVAVAAALILGLVTSSPVATGAESADAPEVTRSLRRALERLPYYGVFDYLAFGVDRGTVTLVGYAYRDTLRSTAELAIKRAARVDVANRLEVLPASQNDDRIRWATF